MIKIGQAVYYLLTGDTSVSSYVGTKIFPLVIPENTETPVIVYERRGDPEYNKDSVAMYNTLVYITIISDKYTEAINITQAVSDRLENYNGVLFGMNIRDVEVTNVQEVYTEDKYVQEISFNFFSN